jgi:Circularly permutated YpsA SLOG family
MDETLGTAAATWSQSFHHRSRSRRKEATDRCRNFLASGVVVLKHKKVVFRQASDQFAVTVADRDGYDDQIHARADLPAEVTRDGKENDQSEKMTPHRSLDDKQSVGEMRHLVKRIISGGQTGADIGGLSAAREIGISTGGFAPLGWMTESGPNEGLLRSFGLKECEEDGYPARTRLNVANSDGTLLVGDYRIGGTRLTYEIAQGLNKPIFLLPYSKPAPEVDTRLMQFRDWLVATSVQVLNVAGNRESEAPGIAEFARLFLVEALR